jgi:MFS family permease
MRIRALSRLDQFFTLPPHANVDPEIARHFRRNFTVNVLDMMTWLFGASFVSVNAVLPVYATHLTNSPIVIGLIPALTDAGWFIPQLFLAPYVERLSRKLPLVAWLGAVERVPYAVLPLAALWLAQPGLSHTTAIVLFILLMAWKSVGSGIVATPWQEMLAKIIPVTHRGRFFGTAHFIGQMLGVGGSAVAALLLARLPYPQNFALSFFVGALGIWASFIFLMFTVEPARTPPPQPPHSNRDYLRRLFHILKRDANFRMYLFSRWFSYFGGMAYGFIAVYAVKRFQMPDSAAAVFTGILYASGVIGYAVWGPIGDRVGHKRVMEVAAGLWLAALAVALLSSAAWGFYVVFALMGFSSAAGVLSDLNIAMEFGPEAERPTYIGLARTFTGPALLVAPLLGGWIAQTWSYPVLFVTSAVFVVGGLALLALRVQEPRHVARPATVVSSTD